jgi:hypothetical protein
VASETEIADALERLTVAAHAQRVAAAKTLPDLNATDLLVLSIIRRAGHITPRVLACTMQLTGGGGHASVRHLVTAGMVDRIGPRFAPRLYATAAGVALSTGTAGWEPELLANLARWPDADARIMMTLLSTAAQSAERRVTVLAKQRIPLDRGRKVFLPAPWG